MSSFFHLGPVHGTVAKRGVWSRARVDRARTGTKALLVRGLMVSEGFFRGVGLAWRAPPSHSRLPPCMESHRRLPPWIESHRRLPLRIESPACERGAQPS